MARTVSDVFKEAFYKAETEEIPTILVTIAHALLPATIYLINNTQQVVSNGNTFLPFPMAIVLPDERAGTVPAMSLRIDNIDRMILQDLQDLDQTPPFTPVTVEVGVILVSDPDTVEIAYPPLGWRLVQYDVLTIEGKISGPPLLNMRYPNHAQSPAFTPAIFRK